MGPLDARPGAQDGVGAKVEVGGAVRRLREVSSHLRHHLRAVGAIVQVLQVHLKRPLPLLWLLLPLQSCPGGVHHCLASPLTPTLN